MFFGKANNLYLFPSLCYCFPKDCIYDCPSNSLNMPPFAQEVGPHLYPLMSCILYSFKPPWQSTWKLCLHADREKSGRRIPRFHSVIMTSQIPCSPVSASSKCSLVWELSYSVWKEITRLQTSFSPAVLPLPQCSVHPPSAFNLHEQLWCGCSRERLTGPLDHLKTGTSKAQPTQTLREFEGLGTRARNTSAAEGKKRRH